MRTRASFWIIPPWRATALVTIVLASSLCGLARGADDDPAFWPAPIDTVKVDANRPSSEHSISQRSGFATVVPLGATAPAGRDLADLLDRTVGLDVHRYGGLGAYATASVRGSSAAQVKVCLDGVPIATAANGAVNLGLLPAACFDHAEIFRGPETSFFAGASAAGVVDLRTPGAVRTPLRVSLGAGSYDTRIGSAQWGASRDAFGLFLSAQLRRSDGDFRYLNRNGTLHGNTVDDRMVKRTNNDLHDSALVWKSAYTPKPFRLEYTGQDYRREGGVPGTENLQTRSVRLKTDEARHQLSALSALGQGMVHLAEAHERFENPNAEVGLAPARTDSRTRTTGGMASLHRPLPLLDHLLRATWSRENERYSPRDLLLDKAGERRTRRTDTSSLDHEAKLGRVSTMTSYRWVRAEDNYTSSVDRESARHHADGLTFGARLDLGRGLSAKANRGHAFRFPTFAELFGENGLEMGNLALKPESGLEWDAGLGYRPSSSLQSELVYFERVMDDEITLIQNSQRTVKAFNLDRVWVRGGELRLFAARALPLRLWCEVQAHGTSQIGRDVGTSRTYRGKRLPNLPLREGFLSLRLSRGAHAIEWEASTRSSAYRDRYNTQAKLTSGHTIHDLSIEERLLSRSLLLRASLDNVGDVRVEDVDGFPLPGRSLTTEVIWTWK